jgi:predicted NBD/HSP70 family sugar kinase
MKVLMIDVGGTNIKLMAAGHEGFRKFPSGERLSAAQMVKCVLAMTEDWDFEAVSIGFPGPIVNGTPLGNPVNLGGGWVGFDFQKAFRRPVRLINDAAMHALSHYDSGRLLFVSLGTSIGTALIADDVIVPIETGSLRFTKSTNFGDVLGDANRDEIGHKAWEKAVWKAVGLLRQCFFPDQIVLGGGNAKSLLNIPTWCLIRQNQDTFRGALRLWPDADLYAESQVTTWRIHRQPVKRSRKKPLAQRVPATNGSTGQPASKSASAPSRQ